MMYTFSQILYMLRVLDVSEHTTSEVISLGALDYRAEYCMSGNGMLKIHLLNKECVLGVPLPK